MTVIQKKLWDEEDDISSEKGNLAVLIDEYAHFKESKRPRIGTRKLTIRSGS